MATVKDIDDKIAKLKNERVKAVQKENEELFKRLKPFHEILEKYKIATAEELEIILQKNTTNHDKPTL